MNNAVDHSNTLFITFAFLRRLGDGGVGYLQLPRLTFRHSGRFGDPRAAVIVQRYHVHTHLLLDTPAGF
jgi:hypothetical protein